MKDGKNIGLKKLVKSYKAFSLVEMIIVIAIIAIISTVAIPLLAGYTEHAKEKVCNLNCAHLKSLYVAFLLTEDIINSGTTFNQFMDHYNINICPCGDIITYSDGYMHCSVHKKNDDEEGKRDDNSVPFL